MSRGSNAPAYDKETKSMNKEFDFNRVNTGLFKFLDASPNAFYAVANIRAKFMPCGFFHLISQ